MLILLVNFWSRKLNGRYAVASSLPPTQGLNEGGTAHAVIIGRSGLSFMTFPVHLVG